MYILEYECDVQVRIKSIKCTCYRHHKHTMEQTLKAIVSTCSELTSKERGSLYEICDHIAAYINKYAQKGIVMSTHDIGDVEEEFLDDTNVDPEEDHPNHDTCMERILMYLVEKGHVYKYGNRDSYCEIVKAQGKVSKTEYHMMKSRAKKRAFRVVFRDIEFHVSDDGRYIV